MIVQRFYDDSLAQTSYLIGCSASGSAIVIDPLRDIRQYLDFAESEELTITHVTETHIHADFVSGVRELAVKTGAKMYLSGEGGPDWQYEFAAAAGAVILHDGDEFKVGNVKIQALHMPGHTPEHLIFLITDTTAADEPIAAVTGDFVFVGDVGRPDLLEKAAGETGTMERSARTLFHSMQRFKQQPEYLQIWPGHGAGSACGKGLSAIPHSTLGYEKLFNWGLAEENEDRFVEAVLNGQPVPPRYFARMKQINRAGPALLADAAQPGALPAEELPRLLSAGAVIVDTRAADEFQRGFLRGTMNIPLRRSFTNWAGSLLPYDRGIYLVVRDDAALQLVLRQLSLIGLDNIAGWFTADALHSASLAQAAPTGTTDVEGAVATGDALILDVRNPGEWSSGHIEGSVNIPLPDLPERMAEVPGDRPVIVHCQTGGRSPIAASLLQAAGRDAHDYRGGYTEWRRTRVQAK